MSALTSTSRELTISARPAFLPAISDDLAKFAVLSNLNAKELVLLICKVNRGWRAMVLTTPHLKDEVGKHKAEVERLKKEAEMARRLALLQLSELRFAFCM